MSVKSVFLKGLMVAGLVLGCEQTVDPVVITLDSNNGTLSAVEQEVMPGEPVKLKANSFTYEGYDFVEWNEKSDGSGKKYPDGGEITVNAALILFAQWSPVKPQKPQAVESFANGTTVKLTLTAPTDAFWDKVVVRQNGVDVKIFEREDLGNYDASNPPALTYTAENLTDGVYVFEVVVYNQETASDPVTEEVTIGSGGGVTDPDPEDPPVEGEVFDVTAGEASFDEADGLTLPFTAGEGFVMPEPVTPSVTLTAGENQVPVTENVAFNEDKTAVIVPAVSLTVGNYTAVALTLSADGYASKTLDYPCSFTVAEEPDATEISNLTASPADESVVLTWTLPTGEFDSFVISCSSDTDTDPAQIDDQTIDNNTATTHTFSGLKNGGSYTFTVKTVSGGQNSAGVTTQTVSLPNIPETIERSGKTLHLVKGFDFNSDDLLSMQGGVATDNSGGTPVTPDFDSDGFFSFTTVSTDVSSINYQYPLEIGADTATYAEIRFSYKGETPAGSVGLGTTSTKDGDGIKNNGWKDEFLYTNKSNSDSTKEGTLYFRCYSGNPLAYNLTDGHSPGMWIRSGIDFSGGTQKTYYVQGDTKGSRSNDHDLSSKSKYWLYIGQESTMAHVSTITLDWIAFYAEETQQ